MDVIINLQELLKLLQLNELEYSNLLHHWVLEIAAYSKQLDQIQMYKDQRKQFSEANSRFSRLYTEISIVTPPGRVAEEHKILLLMIQEYLELLGKANKLYYQVDLKIKAVVEFDELVKVHSDRSALNDKIFSHIKSIAEKI